MYFRIGEKVVVYREGYVEKIEQTEAGTILHIRYKKDFDDKALWTSGYGYAVVDAEIVEKADCGRVA